MTQSKESDKERIERLHSEGSIAAYVGATDAPYLRKQIDRLQRERDAAVEALTAISRGLFSTRNAQTVALQTLAQIEGEKGK